MFNTVDGRIHFAPPKKPWLRLYVSWYLPGNRIILGFLRWCRISSIHSMTEPNFTVGCTSLFGMTQLKGVVFLFGFSFKANPKKVPFASKTTPGHKSYAGVLNGLTPLLMSWGFFERQGPQRHRIRLSFMAKFQHGSRVFLLVSL